MLPLRYLAGYPEDLQQQVREAIAQGRLAPMLRSRYPGTHPVRSDGALFDYTLALKNRFLRNAEPPARVLFDSRLLLRMPNPEIRVVGLILVHALTLFAVSLLVVLMRTPLDVSRAKQLMIFVLAQLAWFTFDLLRGTYPGSARRL